MASVSSRSRGARWVFTKARGGCGERSMIPFSARPLARTAPLAVKYGRGARSTRCRQGQEESEDEAIGNGNAGRDACAGGGERPGGRAAQHHLQRADVVV